MFSTFIFTVVWKLESRNSMCLKENDYILITCWCWVKWNELKKITSRVAGTVFWKMTWREVTIESAEPPSCIFLITLGYGKTNKSSELSKSIKVSYSTVKKNQLWVKTGSEVSLRQKYNHGASMTTYNHLTEAQGSDMLQIMKILRKFLCLFPRIEAKLIDPPYF